jgi:hypothetical protein
MDGVDRTVESPWAPLSRPIFRALWISSLVSNVGTWMQNVGAGAIAGLAAIRRWPLRAISTLDLSPSAHWAEPHLGVVPEPDDGPVRIDVEYRIDPTHADGFADAARDLEQIRLRDGAVGWALYQDPGEEGRYVESFVVRSWIEHLRQHERVTVDDRGVQERIRRFHVAATAPIVTHLIAAR